MATTRVTNALIEEVCKARRGCRDGPERGGLVAEFKSFPKIPPEPLRFFVAGVPGPQGSKNRGRTGYLYEASKKVKPWREAVTATAIHNMRVQAWEPILDGPIWLGILFLMKRPKSHYYTGKRNLVLRPDAPYWHDKLGDGDKLARSTQDALTNAGVWRDDAQVACLRAEKIYANDKTGAHIIVRALTQEDRHGD